MDAKTKHDLLSFIGAGRPDLGPRPTWRVNELQYASVNFALAGEDAVLRSLFKVRLWQGRPGLYADVGCAYPSAMSNTYAFYLVGWRGIGVDANRGYAEGWGQVRPEDAFVWGAASDARTALYWHRHTDNIGASRVAPLQAAANGDFQAGIEVPVVRLDETFARHFGDQQIQLLSLDVEGAELAALRSNDWSRWRPEVIIMECHAFRFEAPLADPAVAYLAGQGYDLHEKIGANVVMVHRDSLAGLRGA